MSFVCNTIRHPDTLSGGSFPVPQRRPLQSLNVIDDFMFTTMSTLPDVAEPFFRILLRTVFGRDFPEITVTPQKVLQGLDTGLHGIRMDVYIEEAAPSGNERAVIYNIEAETRVKDRKHLPRRLRFYNSATDMQHLASNTTYDALPDHVTIVILSYDPFGEGDMLYECRSHLSTHLHLSYDDGLRCIYLYTDGRLNEEAVRRSALGDGQKLRDMLKYMCHSEQGNVTNDDIATVNRLVTSVKGRAEVISGYMRTWDYVATLKRESKDEGRVEGRAEQGLEDAKFYITSSRRLGATDEDILSDLTGHFRLTEEIAHKLLAGEPFSYEFEEKPLSV